MNKLNKQAIENPFINYILLNEDIFIKLFDPSYYGDIFNNLFDPSYLNTNETITRINTMIKDSLKKQNGSIYNYIIYHLIENMKIDKKTKENVDEIINSLDIREVHIEKGGSRCTSYGCLKINDDYGVAYIQLNNDMYMFLTTETAYDFIIKLKENGCFSGYKSSYLQEMIDTFQSYKLLNDANVQQLRNKLLGRNKPKLKRTDRKRTGGTGGTGAQSRYTQYCYES